MSKYLGTDGQYYDYERNLMRMLAAIAQGLNVDVEPEGDLLAEPPADTPDDPPADTPDDPPADTPDDPPAEGDGDETPADPPDGGDETQE